MYKNRKNRKQLSHLFLLFQFPQRGYGGEGGNYQGTRGRTRVSTCTLMPLFTLFIYTPPPPLPVPSSCDCPDLPRGNSLFTIQCSDNDNAAPGNDIGFENPHKWLLLLVYSWNSVTLRSTGFDFRNGRLSVLFQTDTIVSLLYVSFCVRANLGSANSFARRLIPDVPASFCLLCHYLFRVLHLFLWCWWQKNEYCMR